MAVRTTSWLSIPSLLRTLTAHVRLSLRLLREPAVPLLIKLLPFVALAYLVSPIDGVPDFIPLLGQLDDLGVVLLALESFLKLCPETVVAHHRAAMASGRPFSPAPPSAARADRHSSGPAASGSVIDVEFRHEDSTTTDKAASPSANGAVRR